MRCRHWRRYIIAPVVLFIVKITIPLYCGCDCDYEFPYLKVLIVFQESEGGYLKLKTTSEWLLGDNNPAPMNKKMPSKVVCPQLHQFSMISSPILLSISLAKFRFFQNFA